MSLAQRKFIQSQLAQAAKTMVTSHQSPLPPRTESHEMESPQTNHSTSNSISSPKDCVPNEQGKQSICEQSLLGEMWPNLCKYTHSTNQSVGSRAYIQVAFPNTGSVWCSVRLGSVASKLIYLMLSLCSFSWLYKQYEQPTYDHSESAVIQPRIVAILSPGWFTMGICVLCVLFSMFDWLYSLWQGGANRYVTMITTTMMIMMNMRTECRHSAKSNTLDPA